MEIVGIILVGILIALAPAVIASAIMACGGTGQRAPMPPHKPRPRRKE